MSAVEMSRRDGMAPAPGSRRISTRFLRSELKLIFGRRRTIAGMGVLAAVPIIIALAVYYSGGPRRGGGDGGRPDAVASQTAQGAVGRRTWVVQDTGWAAAN